MSHLNVNNLTKSYGQLKALKDVSFQLNKGEITALIGPNGAGKSTFVKCLMGLVFQDQGEILLEGVSSKDHFMRKGIAYLPEKFNFYDFYTVESTLQFFSELRSEIMMSADLDRALDKLGILDLKHRKMKELSKGQMQRVALASMIASKKSFYIFDEPFSGLDPIGIREVKDLFVELKGQGATVLINTHILSEMEKVCDRVLLINKGELLFDGYLNDSQLQDGLEDYFIKRVKEVQQ
ncbi:ABC transporter ATP-binding protein [Halobacteriovorax sp. GB3]|uniref:ABC transporter ATP-binding protein n=1 Tax=Halobacteriovorax sp. GB3 TaxID=2719615 RepID=UPI00235F387C|nr:ABC transporter ATP-binding protein [Halobacteriovorax sp. GB3]MDD0853439.1 ABC transporter ATP-binding protein [Halobacteriovorax sp. GB3]